MDHSSLAARLRSGDAAATAHFVDQYFDDIYRFLRHLTRHVQDAEDLTQQTLLRALRSVDHYDGSSSMRTWLHRIAFREFLNWRRGRRLWRQLDPRTLVHDKGFDEVESSEILLTMLSKLSPHLAGVFLLLEVQELSCAEASEVLGIPIGTVKSRHHEARKRLKAQVQELHGDTYAAEAYEH